MNGEGEDGRQDLEQVKLASEIREIEARTREIEQRMAGGRSNTWREHFKAGAAFFGILVTLVIGTPTALYQFHQYRQQLAAEHRFEVSAVMASMIEKLTSEETSPSEKRGAAIGLSLIGSAAVPILIENLDILHDQPVSETIIQGLEDLLRRQDDPGVVLEPTRHATDRVVSRASDDPNPKHYLSAARHIDALARLIAAATVAQTSEERKVLGEGLQRTLANIDSLTREIPQAFAETIGEKVTSLREAIQSLENSPADGTNTPAMEKTSLR